MGDFLVLVADAHRARIFKKEGVKLSQQGTDIESEKIMRKFDKDSAKPGSVEPGGQADNTVLGHVYAPHTDLEEKENRAFYRKIANYLNQGVIDIEGLILIAPPDCLGELRKLLDDHILDKIEHEVAKDLTKAREEEILKHTKKPYS